MKTSMTHRILRGALGLAVLALPLAFCGCESSDTETDISTTRFNVDKALRNVTDTDEYVWDTTLSEPLATLRINDFIEGDTTLRIYDGRGILVLSAALNTRDSVYFSGDDLYFQRRVNRGEPGQWRIVLGYEDFTGDYNLTLE